MLRVLVAVSSEEMTWYGSDVPSCPKAFFGMCCSMEQNERQDDVGGL